MKRRDKIIPTLFFVLRIDYLSEESADIAATIYDVYSRYK